FRFLYKRTWLRLVSVLSGSHFVFLIRSLQNHLNRACQLSHDGMRLTVSRTLYTYNGISLRHHSGKSADGQTLVDVPQQRLELYDFFHPLLSWILLFFDIILFPVKRLSN